jgi:HEAT repeat protein
MVVKRLLPLLLPTLLTAATLSAQGVESQFTTDKTNYLSGEPVFVALTVSNKGNKPVWVDFKSPDLAKLLCDDFAVEVPGAESAQEQWGCGFAGSCGRSFREVLPGKSLSLRQLVNSQFRLQPGVYDIRAHTTIVVHAQNLYDSPQIAQFDATDDLTVKVQRGNEDQIKAAFQPLVEELDSPDPMKQREAAVAITALAPPFLEDVLVSLAKSSYAYGAISALRRADTSKTRETLAQIATGPGDSMLRIEAARNLGRAHDPTYIPTLFRLMDTDNKEIQNAAAEAAGNLGGAAAIPQLAALLSSRDADTRRAGTNGLGEAHASQAVPLLIGLLLDSDANVRQAAIGGLYLLTHRAAFENTQWADVTSIESAASVHQRWVRWWNSHRHDTKMHGLADCAPPESLD